jgi:hypothetical protein
LNHCACEIQNSKTRPATSWLVYRLTGSTFLLGIVNFAGQIPTIVLGPFAGVWADRWERQQLLGDIGSARQPAPGADRPRPGSFHGVPTESSFTGPRRPDGSKGEVAL